MGAQVPILTEATKEPRHVKTKVYKRGRKPDPDNLLKYLLDALKRVRLIWDDSAEWCSWERPQIHDARADHESTVIELSTGIFVPPEPIAQWQHLTPWGNKLEAEFRARPWYATSSQPKRRDVYIREQDPRDPAARMSFLSHIDCPLSTARRLFQWCEANGIEVTELPAGNMGDGWTFPEEENSAPVPELKPDPALIFGAT